MLTHLKNGHVVDPANDRDAVGDLYLADGVVVDAPTDGRRTMGCRRGPDLHCPSSSCR